MRFRTASSHALCNECVKHKYLIRRFSHHLNARTMQQTLLYEHLEAQFADRMSYWMARGRSRCRGPEVVIIVDGMDQGKFACPRSSLLKAKQFDSMSRPRLHVAGAIIHGWSLNFFVSEANLPKDSNTSLEILSRCVTSLRDSGQPLSTTRVVIQADNTCREIKNGITMRWMAALISDNIIKEGVFSFLRSGHSHEDIDQVFGQCSDWVKRRVPTAQTSDDFVSGINAFLQKMERPHEIQRACFKLDRTRDWSLGVVSVLVAFVFLLPPTSFHVLPHSPFQTLFSATAIY